MERRTTPKAVKGWGIVDPKNRLIVFDRTKRWALISAGIMLMGAGARSEKWWNEKGYHCIRVLITPL